MAEFKDKQDESAFEDMPVRVDKKTPAQSFVRFIQQFIQEEHYEKVLLLFAGKDAQENLAHLKYCATELFRDICLPHLNDEIFHKNPILYKCVEDLLIILATHGEDTDELLLELLEIVEENHSEMVFTSALKALQVILLRAGASRPRAMGWVFNSIQNRLEELSLPEILAEGYDDKQAQLLEQNPLVLDYLTNLVTVSLFYQPIVNDIVEGECRQLSHTSDIFYDCGMNRPNVVSCFFLQLLGKPLALLDLTMDGRKTNPYTVQIAKSLTIGITKCIGNPMYLMLFLKDRISWNNGKTAETDMSDTNLFLYEEQVPHIGLCTYYYMVFTSDIVDKYVRSIYSSFYLFEAGLYVTIEMLLQDETPLHYRSLLLLDRILDYLEVGKSSAKCLKKDVHPKFCELLCKHIGYSSQKHIRQLGTKLLKKYIYQFNDEGRFLVIKNLLRTVSHMGISGYLATIYKDLVCDALVSSRGAVTSFFSGYDFQMIFLQHICVLPEGAKTDIMANSDKIISALNTIRFFAIKDIQNRIGFWDLVKDLRLGFVEPLRTALNFSTAHYKKEIHSLTSEDYKTIETNNRKKLKLLNISIQNAAPNEEGNPLDLNTDKKLEILNRALCNFELIRSLMARAVECLESQTILM